VLPVLLAGLLAAAVLFLRPQMLARARIRVR
jgi:hypothetical protein